MFDYRRAPELQSLLEHSARSVPPPQVCCQGTSCKVIGHHPWFSQCHVSQSDDDSVRKLRFQLKRQDWNGGKEGQCLQQRGSLSSNVIKYSGNNKAPSKSSKKALIPNYGPSSQRWKSIQNNHSSNQQPDHVGLSLKTTLGDTGIPGIRTPLAALRQWWDSISMSFL